MAKSTFTLEWEAPEHEHKVRSADWFWVTGIIVFSLALVSIIFGNIIFAILIIVAAFSLGLFINRPPESINAGISDTGIRKESVLYPFETLEAFWIELEHPHKKILLRSKRPLMPLIIIPIADELNSEEVRLELSKHLKEEHLTLPLVEKILEFFGF